MDAATLAQAMGCSRSTADRYVAACNTAMIQAGCTTINRAAMWLAQLGHESGGLKWMSEIWGPTAAQRRYEGRRDLGNIYPGDGSRFRGRSAIQITGRHNYTAVSKWAHGKGYVPTPAFFVDNPAEMASERYGFTGAVWYWIVARPKINSMCDQADVTGVTRQINGGTNGLADRRNRWNRCRGLGNRILPTGSVAPVHEEEPDLDPEQNRMLWELYKQLVEGTGNARDPKSWGWPGWAGGTNEKLTTTDALRRLNVEVRQARNQIAALQAEVKALKGR